MNALLSALVVGAWATALGESLLRRRDLSAVYATDFGEGYHREPVTFAAISLHAPLPVLHVLSAAPLGAHLHRARPRDLAVAPSSPRLSPRPPRYAPGPPEPRARVTQKHYDRPYSAPHDSYDRLHFATQNSYERPETVSPGFYEHSSSFGTPRYYEESRTLPVRYYEAPYVSSSESEPTYSSTGSFVESALPVYDSDVEDPSGAVLYARPDPSGGYTYRRRPHDKRQVLKKTPHTEEPVIIRIHRHRIVRS